MSEQPPAFPERQQTTMLSRGGQCVALKIFIDSSDMSITMTITIMLTHYNNDTLITSFN